MHPTVELHRRPLSKHFGTLSHLPGTIFPSHKTGPLDPYCPFDRRLVCQGVHCVGITGAVPWVSPANPGGRFALFGVLRPVSPLFCYSYGYSQRNRLSVGAISFVFVSHGTCVRLCTFSNLYKNIKSPCPVWAGTL